MLSDLLDVVDALDLAPRGDDITAALRARDVLNAKIAAAVGEFDARGDWGLDEATSTTAWLRTHGDLAPGEAGALTRTARRVHRLPATRAAWIDGRLSSGQVQAIIHNVDDATIDLLERDEDELIPFLEPLDAHDTATVMRDWKSRADALVDRPEPKEPLRSAHLSRLLDGRGRLDADLDAEGCALARTALRLATTRDGEADEPRSHARKQGDALVDIFRFFLDHQDQVPGGRNRPHVNVVLRYEDLATGEGATFADGTPVPPEAVRRMACDSDINRVVVKGRSVILDYGSSTRLFSPAQFAVMALRDRRCRFPGCDRPPEWCEAHHVIAWEDGGPTDVANGVLLCSRHHHVTHLPGWHTKLEPDGTFHVTAPDGRHWTTRPAGVLTFDV